MTGVIIPSLHVLCSTVHYDSEELEALTWLKVRFTRNSKEDGRGYMEAFLGPGYSRSTPVLR